MKMKIQKNHSLYQYALTVPLCADESQSLSLVSFPHSRQHGERKNRHLVTFLQEPLEKTS